MYSRFVFYLSMGTDRESVLQRPTRVNRDSIRLTDWSTFVNHNSIISIPLYTIMLSFSIHRCCFTASNFCVSRLYSWNHLFVICYIPQNFQDTELIFCTFDLKEKIHNESLISLIINTAASFDIKSTTINDGSPACLIPVPCKTSAFMLLLRLATDVYYKGPIDGRQQCLFSFSSVFWLMDPSQICAAKGRYGLG